MKQFYKYDENGIFTEPVIFTVTVSKNPDGEEFTKITDISGNLLDKLPDNVTNIKPPDGLWKAKFTGDEWIETGELPEAAPAESVKPTIEQRLEACEAAIIELAGELPASTRGLAAVSEVQVMGVAMREPEVKKV